MILKTPPTKPINAEFQIKIFFEILLTIFSVLFCYLIYSKSKKIYDLTKYESINYFSKAFLFFGLSYLIRFIFGIFLIYSVKFNCLLPKEFIIVLFILPLIYFSTISIFYLLLCTIFKNLRYKNLIFIIHFIFILLTIISFITHSYFILMILQFILIMLILITLILSHLMLSDKTKIKVLYFFSISSLVN